MSIFGAMTTAIAGLGAQSSAFSNVGDNVANTQTIGYKSVDTSFDDYITVSTSSINESGSVVARPSYNNSVQGSITSAANPLDLAISGAGFFPVSLQSGTTPSGPTFDGRQLYTRAGDFKLNASGYLVNSTGAYLNGWPADDKGVVDQTKLTQLQVGQSGYAPIPTSNASIVANLPATPPTTTPPPTYTTEMPVIDSFGTSQTVDLSWTPKGSGQWTLGISQGGTQAGTYDVTFDSSGKLASIGAPGTTTNQQLIAPFTATFGSNNQTINLNLGTIGGTDGVTQFAGTTYNLVSTSQDGVRPGSFTSVSMQQDGKVLVNYDNGSSRVLAQIPIVTFASPDQLQRHDGQAFAATNASGTARVNQAGGNGAGTLVTGSLEASNVDIAGEFTKLIVAQRAYSANTKMVTTADELLQQTIDMKR